MNEFIKRMISWQTSCYITLNFLLYFFITNGLEYYESIIIKILIGILSGIAITIIMERENIMKTIHKNKKHLIRHFSIIFMVFIGAVYMSLPKELIKNEIASGQNVQNFIDTFSLELFHGIIFTIILLSQYAGYTAFITSKEMK